MHVLCDCRDAENGQLSPSQGFSVRVQRSAGRGGADGSKDPGPAAHCAGEDDNRELYF